jgi:tetratricopeptide (TPR) repeat protein
LELQRKVLPADDPTPLNTASGLAEALEAQGKLEEALAVHRQNLADAVRIRGENHTTNRQQFQLLGRCLLKLERYEEAEPILLKGLAIAQDPAAPNVRSAASFVEDLAKLYDGWKKPQRAQEHQAWAARLRASTQPASTQPATAPSAATRGAAPPARPTTVPAAGAAK